MIYLIIWLVSCFTGLLYETDWMRVRLLVGAYTPKIELIQIRDKWGKLKDERPIQRKWQFSRFGDDCIMMRDRCYITGCSLCRKGDRWFTWRIPARTVKVFGSTINFKEGCNLYRAKLLKDIYKAQNSKAIPSYHKNTGSYDSGCLGDCEPSIELLVDGKPIANINGDYKRGIIKSTLKPYTKARVNKGGRK